MWISVNSYLSLGLIFEPNSDASGSNKRKSHYATIEGLSKEILYVFCADEDVMRT